MNKSKKTKLYKMEFSTLYNKNLSPRTEYIKTKIPKKTLWNDVMRWCKLDTTEYYGYTRVVITEQKDVPEIMTLKIRIKPKK